MSRVAACVLTLATALAACRGPQGLSSRDEYKGKPGSDKLCQVYEGGGGLRPGVGVVISMLVGNDRTCLWGFNASNFGGVGGGEQALHGTVSVQQVGDGKTIYAYTPNPGYVGSDRFGFTLSRGDGYDNRISIVVDVVQGERDPAPTTGGGV